VDASENWVAEALSDALGGATTQQRSLLARLAARSAPWTVDEVAVEAGLASSAVVASLRALLAVGLIRPADGDSAGARRFMALNLVRRLLV
jgi:predicted transcriptional regulator